MYTYIIEIWHIISTAIDLQEAPNLGRPQDELWLPRWQERRLRSHLGGIFKACHWGFLGTFNMEFYLGTWGIKWNWDDVSRDLVGGEIEFWIKHREWIYWQQIGQTFGERQRLFHGCSCGDISCLRDTPRLDLRKSNRWQQLRLQGQNGHDMTAVSDHSDSSLETDPTDPDCRRIIAPPPFSSARRPSSCPRSWQVNLTPGKNEKTSKMDQNGKYRKGVGKWILRYNWLI